MTQLYALIKSNSEHYSHRWHNVDEKGKPTPFKVTIPSEITRGGQALGGVGGNYYINELNLYVIVNDKFVRV
jgi:hypothetical protein